VKNLFKREKEKGFVLVLVLLVVALLTTLVVDFAYGVYVNMNGLNNLRTMEKLSIECSSLIQSTSGLLQQGITSGVIKPGAPEMEIPLDESVTLFFKAEDENGKFNLNSLVGTNLKYDKNEPDDKFAYDSFKRLLRALKLEEGIADKVIDWTDKDDIPMPLGNEKSSKNAFLESISELKLFIDPASYARLEPYITIYGDTTININTASVPVLMSLSDEIDKEMAARVITFREREPFKYNTDLQRVPGFKTITTSLVEHLTDLATSTPTVYTLRARAEENGIKKVIEAITENGTIKYWRES
jgi:general secretion pathway protein K